MTTASSESNPALGYEVQPLTLNSGLKAVGLQVNLTNSGPEGLLMLSDFIRSLVAFMEGKPHRISIEVRSADFQEARGQEPKKDGSESCQPTAKSLGLKEIFFVPRTSDPPAEGWRARWNPDHT